MADMSTDINYTGGFPMWNGQGPYKARPEWRLEEYLNAVIDSAVESRKKYAFSVMPGYTSITSGDTDASALWESGGINESTGAYVATNTRMRTKATLIMQPGDAVLIDTSSHPKVAVVLYKLNGDFLGTLKYSSETTVSEVTIREKCLVRITVGKADDSAIASGDIATLTGYVSAICYSSSDVSFVDQWEPGQLSTSTAYILHNTTGKVRHRSKGFFEVEPGDILRITFDPSDVSRITAVRFFFYDENAAYMSNYKFATGESVCMQVPANAHYFKAGIHHATGEHNFKDYTVTAAHTLRRKFLPTGYSASFHAYAFNYVVSGTYMGFGRLLLPPNYSMDGEPVPLAVYFHGSGAMTHPGAPIPYAYEDYFNYLLNEGIAWFDCYPWTDKVTYDSNSRPYSPLCIPLHQLSYIEGVKYVCEHFNVDIGSVVCFGKSQGGNLTHWAAVEADFPFKAVGMLAPTVDPLVQGSNAIFYNKNTRKAMTDFISFAGTSTEINAFINDGNVTNSDVQSFISKNKSKLIGMLPYAQGINGATSPDSLIEGGYETLLAEPSWMTSEGVPEWSASYDLIPKFANHSDYSKNAKRPVKIWGAFDDSQVSMYGNYAIYRYLMNGGSDVEFREMPLNTGGHHSVDTDENALKSSGTTRLGITYTDIPTAYVELADFFFKSLGR